jgi:hypothetical protein
MIHCNTYQFQSCFFSHKTFRNLSHVPFTVLNWNGELYISTTGFSIWNLCEKS